MAIPVRVIGTTGASGGNQRQPTQIEGRNNQQSEESLARGVGYVEQAGQSLQRSSEIVQQTSARVAEVSAQAGASPRFAQAFEGLAKVAESFSEMQAKRRQAEAEAQGQLDESIDAEQRLEAMQQLQTIVDNARGVIEAETYERGVPIVREQVRRVLASFEGLSAETVKQLMTSVDADLTRINGEQWNEAARNRREARDTQAAVVFEQNKIEAQGLIDTIAARGAWMPQEELDGLLNQTVSVMTDNDEFRALDPINQLRYQRDMLQHIGRSVGEQSRVRADIDSAIERDNSAINEMQQVQLAYDNGQISPEVYTREIERIQRQWRSEKTPWGQRQDIELYMEETQLYRDLQELERTMAYEAAPELGALEVGKVVASIAQGRLDVTALDPNDPMTPRIREVWEMYQGGRSTSEQVTSRTTALNAEQNQLRRELSQLQRLAQAYASASDEEREEMPLEAKRAFDNYNTRGAEIQGRLAELDQEALDLQRGYNQNREQLRIYGLHQGADQFMQFYNAPDVQRQRTEANSRIAEQRARGTAGFNYGGVGSQSQPPRPLARLAQPRFGLDAGAYVPFTADVEGVVVTSGWSGHEGGRAGHGGVDFGVPGNPLGTAGVAAVRSGRVVASGSHGNTGWGNFVVVEDQNGYRAVYAHLHTPSPLREGEIVSQGTKIGYMGSSGRSTASHLHFSVIKPNGPIAESHGTIDPIQYIRESVNEGAATGSRGQGMPPSSSGMQGQYVPAVGPSQNTSFQIAQGPPPAGAYILPDQSGWVYGNTMFFTDATALENAMTRRRARADSLTAPAYSTGPSGVQRPTAPGARATGTGGPQSLVQRGSLGRGYEALEELGGQLPQLSTRFSSDTPEGRAATVLALAIGGTEVYSQGSTQRDFFSRRGGATLDGRPNTMLGFGQFNQDYHARYTQNPSDYANYIGEMLTGARAQPNGSPARNWAAQLNQAVQSGQIRNGAQLRDWIRNSGLGGSNWQGISDGWGRVPGLENQLFQLLRGGNRQSIAEPQTAEELFHAANPSRNSRASNDRRDYGDMQAANKPENNYGYEALEQDEQFRTRLAQAATAMGVPAQWLADTVALETEGTFAPRHTNSEGCVGIVRFCPDNPGGTQVTVAGRTLTTTQIQAMTRSEQLELVIDRIEQGRNGRDIEHAHQVALLAVGAGAQAFRPPSELRGINAQEYLTALGKHVGRRYETPYDNIAGEEVHDTLTAGCPYCNSLVGSGSFIAHVVA